MIVRIMGEGQRELSVDEIDELNRLDEIVEQTVEADDESAFQGALETLLNRARSMGVVVPDDVLVPSDAVLPPSDATLLEVRELLSEDGLIPG